MSVVCGRCGNYTAPGSTYCAHDGWTLITDVPGEGPRSSALDSIEVPKGMAGFWARRNQAKDRNQLERTLQIKANEHMYDLERIVQDDPTDFEAHRGLGLLSMLAGHWERANAHLSRAHEINSDDFETHINYGIVLAHRGQLKPALDILEQARRRWPDAPLAWFNLALVALQARRPQVTLDAVDALERLWIDDISLSEEYHDDAMTARGLAFLELSKPTDAYEALKAAAQHTIRVKLKGAQQSEDSHGEHLDIADQLIVLFKPSENTAAVPEEEYHEMESRAPIADQLNNFALAEVALGNTEQGLNLLARALRLEPTHTRVLNNLAVLSYQQGQFQSAYRYAELARHIEEKLDKPEPTTFNHLGVILSALGRLDEALEYFQRAGSHEQAEFEVYYNLGRAFIEYGKPDKGVEKLRLAFQLNPSHADLQVVLGAAYLFRGRHDLLEQAMGNLKKALQLNRYHRSAYANLAMVLLELENRDAAILVLETARKAFPKSAEIAFLMGLITFLRGEGNDFAMAATQFAVALDARPDLIACLYNVALSQYLMGFRDTAAQLLEKVTDRDSSFAPAYYLIGVGHAEAKRYDQALRAWETALQYETQNADLLSNIGYVHYQRSEWKAAIKYYLLATQASPRDSDTLAALGLTYARAEMFHQAISSFNKSLTLNPRSPITHSNLGLTYYLNKQVERALEHWRIVSQIDPGYASRREEEQQRKFDDSDVSLRPFRWRERVVKLAPVLPRPHTRLQPGYNARNYRYAISDRGFEDLKRLYLDLEFVNRSLALLNVK